MEEVPEKVVMTTDGIPVRGSLLKGKAPSGVITIEAQPG